MATGWHMLLGGVPLLALSIAKEGDQLGFNLQQLTGKTTKRQSQNESHPSQRKGYHKLLQGIARALLSGDTIHASSWHLLAHI